MLPHPNLGATASAQGPLGPFPRQGGRGRKPWEAKRKSRTEWPCRWGWTRAAGQGMVAPSRGATSWTTPGIILCICADEEENTCDVHKGCGRGMRSTPLRFIPNPVLVLRILLYHREGSLCTHSVPISTLLKVS